MTPFDLTSDHIIAWGGPKVFNLGLHLVKRNAVGDVHWDESTGTLSGKVDGGSGYKAPVSIILKGDGKEITSKCFCQANREFGQVCQHVTALGIHAMVSMMPEVPPDSHPTPQKRPQSESRVTASSPSTSAPSAPSSATTLTSLPATPEIHLMVYGSSAASISVHPVARYYPKSAHPVDVVLGELDEPERFFRPDEDDPDVLRIRNEKAEVEALDRLRSYGFSHDDVVVDPQIAKTLEYRLAITDPHGVLNFLGTGVPSLRRLGWKIRYSERLAKLTESMPMIIPVVSVRDTNEAAFDVTISFDDGLGGTIPQTEIQRAVNCNNAYIFQDGHSYLLDVKAVRAMQQVFADCAEKTALPRNRHTTPGTFRVASVYGAYVRNAVEGLESVDLDMEHAPSWERATNAVTSRDHTARFESIPLGTLESVLRPYQKTGVYWMRFLERSGYCGLLADEMGLGKTLQTLTWLSLERCDPASRGKPALVVCPTSLVANWAAEAHRFVPWMDCLVVSGPDRESRFAAIPRARLVITSYALLPRDFDAAYADVTFSVVVLDEAQRIKNRTTQAAQSVKALTADRRLVLTGTPVENSVSDVWSIFDFLMPDYLGDYELFRETTELPIAAGGPEAVSQQMKLHHMLNPFILRRLKTEVAKDLPDKIVKVHYCPTTPEQQQAEREIRAKARGVTTKFQMLGILMRLRQAANHLGLLSPTEQPRQNDPAAASGKLEAFLDILDEARDGGHRMLVFSQFVGMLSILRTELDARNIPYCYLDGNTKDRLGECNRFNATPSIPVFLISLMAGGTGLNLTGADMVVHFDPWWNPAVEAQATDRAHRIGQKKKVLVVKLISSDTIEERVLALQKKKQLVINATVGGQTDAAILEKLTFDDVRALAGL